MGRGEEQVTMDYITLLGSEDVERAGHQITRAAETMRQTAADMDRALHQHRVWMDEWLNRLASILEMEREQR